MGLYSKLMLGNKSDRITDPSSDRPIDTTIHPILNPSIKQSRDPILKRLSGRVKKRKMQTFRDHFENDVEIQKRFDAAAHEYKKKTGERLTKSRVYRRAINKYLKELGY